VKAAVDADGGPGTELLTGSANLLTGSANLLTMPGAQESLAGRAETVANIPETSLPPYLDLLTSLGLIHTLPPWGATCANASSGAPRSPYSTPASHAAWPA
jgi:hypothetical protein